MSMSSGSCKETSLRQISNMGHGARKILQKKKVTEQE